MNSPGIINSCKVFDVIFLKRWKKINFLLYQNISFPRSMKSYRNIFLNEKFIKQTHFLSCGNVTPTSSFFLPIIFHLNLRPHAETNFIINFYRNQRLVTEFHFFPPVGAEFNEPILLLHFLNFTPRGGFHLKTNLRLNKLIK